MHREGMGGWLIYAYPDDTLCSENVLPKLGPRKQKSGGANSSVSWILMAKTGNCSVEVKMGKAIQLGNESK